MHLLIINRDEFNIRHFLNFRENDEIILKDVEINKNIKNVFEKVRNEFEFSKMMYIS